MKKLLFILLLTIVCVGCAPSINEYYSDLKEENTIYGWNYIDPSVKYRVVQIDGHDYIFVKKDGHGGVSIIHSESCPCKKKKK